MTTRAKVFVDTNVLVYLANISSPYHAEVIEKFTRLQAAHMLVISRQVIREYAVVMTRPGIVEHPLNPAEVADDIEKWKAIFDIVDETEVVTDQLMAFLRKYDLKGKRIHDANIAATMVVAGISSIFTMNPEDFKKFDEIIVVEKF